METANKHFAVVGLGRSGIAAANFLAGRGGRVELVEARAEALAKDAAGALNPAVEVRYGTSEPPARAECIVLSPGVDSEAEFLRPARERGQEIIGEIELASRHARAPIIAVTGTNGKTTCTTLIGNILKTWGKDAPTGGNIGTPFISLVDRENTDFFVIEVSSFQLETIHRFRPRIAVWLNISPDHLDRHKTLENYIRIKARIAMNQSAGDALVLNHDDRRVMEAARPENVRTVFFSQKSRLEEGVFVSGQVILSRFIGEEEILCRIDELKEPTRWQMENVLAAAAAAHLAGAPRSAIADALRDYAGMAHRLEWVRTLNGIDFINDSKGTNVGALEKSLQSVTRPVILIAGGKDKAGDFAPLAALLKSRVKHMVLIGETKTKFRQILNGSFSYEDAETLKDAIDKAYTKAEAGDVVLLSPACASFDMFTDYEDRGNQFKTHVYEL